MLYSELIDNTCRGLLRDDNLMTILLDTVFYGTASSFIIILQ